MSSQTVMWTAVPDGVEGDQARIVCVVSPRLTDPGRTVVQKCPDWLNWAERAAKITFGVRFGSGPVIAATRVSPAPEARRWTAVVQPGLPVRPFTPASHADHRIRSYPAANVAGFLKQKYLDTAVAFPTDFPPVVRHLDGGVGAIGLAYNPKTEQNLRAVIENALNQAKAIPAMAPNPVLDFLLAVQFHETDPKLHRVPPKQDQLDFHQVLSVLAQYPALQRRLGLVFDLRVPLSAAAGATAVSVVPTWTPALSDTVTVSPATKITVGTGVFSPAPKPGSDLDKDALNVRGPGFGVVTVDADGGALKARQFADNLRRGQVQKSADTPDRASLPALRSAGIAVVRSGRAARQVQRFTDSVALEQALASGSAVTLDADALLYGLRWAVFDVASQRWYSLCERRGSYAFPTAHDLDLQLTDSGPVTTSVTQRPQETLPDYYLAEYLARWEGESLVAPRPGKSLDRDPKQGPSAPDPDPQSTIGLKVQFAPAPGSLPPLRYGRRYRLRATAAYLGGAGPRFDPANTTADFSHATDEVTYGRLEPVPPPAVAARAPRVPGESLHHLVIRSDRDTPAAATVPTERHVLPPKASQLLAEAHGLFDTASGLDKTVYAAIAARAGGALAGGTADPSDPSIQYFDSLSFTVENGTKAPVPWIADPLARGAVLTGLPGVPFGPTVVDFGYAEGRTWRNVQPFRIRVTEGTAAPAFDPVNRVLTVCLGKADVAEVSLSSLLRTEDLGLLEIWRWIQNEASLPSADLATHKNYALTGRHWILTPAQPLTLVHAVRRPLVQPQFHALTSVRELGKPVATLKAGGMGISRKSTIAVDLRAEWTDPVDTLDADGWQPRKLVTRTTHLGQVPVALADATHDENTVDLAIPHDFNDTFAHSVAYYPTAKSRFAEHFTESSDTTVRIADDTWFVVDAQGLTPGSEIVTASGTTFARGKDYELSEYQIRRLPDGGIAAGTTVAINYRPATTLAGNPAMVGVPSSARPAPPAPLYVVPTFAWSATPSNGGTESTRKGGGLRIYLDRPWWSSGDGELLGVVLWAAPAGATTIDPLVKPYVTGWGRDPLYLAAPTPHLMPTVADFPRATLTRAGVHLAERDSIVSVAGHPVQADPDRKLWFCDVELTPGQAHQPFVRLALARFQPNSLVGAEISHVVLADFAQLAPDRTASVIYGSDPNAVNLGVTGSSYGLSMAGGVPTGVVEVTVERRDPGIPGDLGWVAEAPQVLTAQPLSSGDTSWHGKVKLPVARGSEPMQLVVREFEGLAGGPRLTYTDVIAL
ncbi:MAG: hypothetical protein QOI35_885 [Cryptosporangiaceae bacterium]|nr:hypothetical protein [Cryptosporangiaceae bacterium]